MRFLLLLLLAASPASAGRASYTTGYMYSYYVPPAAATPWRPAWSPDGKEPAFSIAGSIRKIRVGDDTAYELTANPGYDQYVVADAGPVYVYCGDQPMRSREDAEYFTRWIDVSRDRLRRIQGGAPIGNANTCWISSPKRAGFLSSANDFEQRKKEVVECVWQLES